MLFVNYFVNYLLLLNKSFDNKDIIDLNFDLIMKNLNIDLNFELLNIDFVNENFVFYLMKLFVEFLNILL